MKREELKALGIEGDALEQVMALHGRDLERQKAALGEAQAEAGRLREQYEAEAGELREQLRKTQARGWAEKQADKLNFSSQSARNVFLERFLSGNPAMQEDGSLEGFAEFTEQFRSEDPDAFRTETPQMVASASGLEEPVSLHSLSYQQRLELKRNDPDAYEAYRQAERM